jgi:prepilin-type N-terminal cleavage/methylation domain-containing protein
LPLLDSVSCPSIIQVLIPIVEIIAVSGFTIERFMKQPPLSKSLHPPHPGRPAFTLAELLIALAILGVIATFTIPKVLQSQQDSKKTAIFKETIAAIAGVVQSSLLTGDGPPRTQYMWPLFQKHLNYIKHCTTDAIAEGCWIDRSGSSMDDNNEGYVLPNGATLIDVSYSSFTAGGISIDWNGLAGPNVFGDDRMHVLFVFDDWTAWGHKLKAGQVVPDYGDAASVTLYQQIYQ